MNCKNLALISFCLLIGTFYAAEMPQTLEDVREQRLIIIKRLNRLIDGQFEYGIEHDSFRCIRNLEDLIASLEYHEKYLLQNALPTKKQE